MGYRWDGRRRRQFFQTREGSYNTDTLIAFLNGLKRHQRAILVWGGLPAHKSRTMTEYLLSQRGWLAMERLPGYAPDLNPIETMWGNIKGNWPIVAPRISPNWRRRFMAAWPGFESRAPCHFHS